jgi:transcriptional regulator with XRE-family HTH domain
MEKVTAIRLLRLRYGITLKEFAAAAGVSHQYISDVELGKYGRNEGCALLMQKAFEKIIEQKSGRVSEFTADYAGRRNRLLDFIAEDEHEL